MVDSINGNQARNIDTVGKIYVKGSYVFVNEPNQGIHVIDNSNPGHPVQTAFLRIPGNLDIAIRGNILYADMYDALLAIDISDLHHVKATSRLPGIFASRIYGYANTTNPDWVVIGYKTRDTTIAYQASFSRLPFGSPVLYNSFPSASSSSGSGVAGSMAKMVLLGDHLYAIGEPHSFQVVNLENSTKPSLGARVSVGFDLETAYPFQDKLFLGSAEGVYIFDLSDPSNPVAAGNFTHGRACDPVVSDGDYAYVTLHTGTACGGAANELDIVDVKDLKNPVQVNSYPMTRPMGLAKDGDLLFVCDGPGVKAYDASDPSAIQQYASIDASNAYDVIALNKHLLVMSDNGLSQYDYSQPGKLSLLSLLPIGRAGKK